MFRLIDMIVVHCSATRPSMDIGAAEIRQWHLAKGWADIGYHHVIRRSGLVEPGRPHDHIGAHAEGYNARSIGVCLVGGLSESGVPAAEFTDPQWRALRDLLKILRLQFPETRILGHRDLPNVAKACPSFDVGSWLDKQGIPRG